MTNQRAVWRVVFESYPCPTCGVPAGASCRTTSGRIAGLPHAARTAMANRCPRCGVIVGRENDPGGLCDRCALVRALEVERATKWKRRHP